MGVGILLALLGSMATSVIAVPAPVAPTVVLGDAAAPPAPDAAPAPRTEPRMIGGFRMEGAPEVDVVFGDTRAFRARIDRFFELESAMTEARRGFSRRVQAALAVLVQSRRGCDTGAIAGHYYAAQRAIEEYRRLGISFEIEYTAITTLDRFGETQGLTPDYRWKVKKVPHHYKASLTDYREMQIELVDQLERDLTYRGCKLDTLMREGQNRTASEVLAYATPVPPPRRSWRHPKPEPVVPASTVTFFIDNRTCQNSLRVVADGVVLGEVPAAQRAAFQTLAGNHAICLIPTGPANAGRECGQSGTVRQAYVHDGWAMTMQCRK